VDPDPIGHKPEHPPGQSVWPIGFAIGIACILVGLVISWWVVAIGAAITLVFGLLWIMDLSGHPVGGSGASATEPAVPGPSGTARHHTAEATSRSGFLALTTLALGGLIGALVSIPPLFVAMIPPFLKQSKKPVDLGPLDLYPLNDWRIVTFRLVPNEGPVWNRTAYIRYNGPTKSGPSFTIISNRCAHLGCPVQPLGLVQAAQKKTINSLQREPVETTPILAVSGFSCPCHGGAYDTEGNRTAGPPVRALDRYQYSIVKGRLILGTMYSVAHVDGTGAQAEIQTHKLYGPGQHVDGWEQIFYPFTPPN
jgi:Rieske Fe-S protein